MNPIGRTAYLRKFEGTSREWMDELRGAWSRTGCPNAGASKKNELLLTRALRNEVKKYAVTKADHDFLQILDGRLARAQAHNSEN